MNEPRTSDTQYSPGDPVIYTRLERPKPTEWPAKYVRRQLTSGRVMHVIRLEGDPRARQVGDSSIRPAV